MPERSTLKLEFGAANEKIVRVNYSNIDPDVTGAQVKTLMQDIVTNKAIFVEPPLTLRGATLETLESMALDLS